MQGWHYGKGLIYYRILAGNSGKNRMVFLPLPLQQLNRFSDCMNQ